MYRAHSLSQADTALGSAAACEEGSLPSRCMTQSQASRGGLPRLRGSPGTGKDFVGATEFTGSSGKDGSLMEHFPHGTRLTTLVKMCLGAASMALLMFFVEVSKFDALPLPSPEFRTRDPQTTHVLVTGGAGYIGSHASLRLLKDGFRVTIIDNLSRGNLGAVTVLKGLAAPGMLQFIKADLGDPVAVDQLFRYNKIDVVMHFAAVAYVGESMADPLKYYHNITTNTLTILEAMARHGVLRLIYSSTCATYGEPEHMPIREDTVQNPINPYGKAKKMAEDIIKDFVRVQHVGATILRYFNVIGSDPEGRLGEMPRAELRNHGRISGACFDAALGNIEGLRILGTNYHTRDGTCIRDFIHVTDLVDAHVVAMKQLLPGNLAIYNVGTGKGSSVREFVNACLRVTGKPIKVVEVLERRPGDYAEVYSDPAKILEDLGWKARYLDLEESLRMAWAWRQKNPWGYPEAA
eukprot:TRINITY_DN11625_c0_g1_i1.p1 TRINITY_DN11625_c0_g1~~TRINITY_DN11625_c0_g1_i1.p1  ORF type:complete len:465 (-),score=71.98 TRINITY_DN11625_c0_g1_i1:1151-2545(-)